MNWEWNSGESPGESSVSWDRYKQNTRDKEEKVLGSRVIATERHTKFMKFGLETRLRSKVLKAIGIL